MTAPREHPWSLAELQKLKALIDEGRQVPEIARILDRDQREVRRRAALEGWYASPSLFYSPLQQQEQLIVRLKNAKHAV